MTRSDDFKNFIIAVVAGDEREQEIARLAAATGATVRAFGFPWPAAGIPGVARVKSAEEALAGAHFALFPIPGIAQDGSLFSEEKIIPRDELLSRMAPRAHIILGKADRGLEEAAGRLGITLHEYEADQELMLLRAPAIVEGALRLIIENTPFTIHGARTCVVGQGNIGTVLTRTLIGLGARVTVAARNPVQRAVAFTAGADAVALEELPAVARNTDILLSTVPAPVVTAAVLDALPAHAFVMDLAAPPGGVDLAHARARGLAAVWGRALGRRAPVTVGASQWRGIERIIRSVIESRSR